MKQYIGTKVIQARPMTRKEYNDYRGWTVPADEDPTDLGYLVEYLDGGQSNHPQHKGYISWSPKQVFDNAYRPSGFMTFGDALVLLKQGSRVTRAGWNGKGMWLSRIPHWDAPLIEVGDHTLVKFNTLPFLAMRTATGELVPWLASQTDVLAEDWSIVQ